jgi:hypothetical protein
VEIIAWWRWGREASRSFSRKKGGVKQSNHLMKWFSSFYAGFLWNLMCFHSTN